jgi:hypothetical protein
MASGEWVCSAHLKYGNWGETDSSRSLWQDDERVQSKDEFPHKLIQSMSNRAAAWT